MVATDATLQHTSVNGGTAVALNMQQFNYGWKNLGDAKYVKASYDIAEGEQKGFENPVIVLECTIDTDSSASNTITQSLLMDFAQADISSNDMTLTILCAGEATGDEYLKGRPSAGYSVGGSYTNSLKVRIVSFNINSNIPESKEGRIWNVSIEFQEVR